MDIYDRLGVRKLINAVGTASTVGGSVMPSRVFDVMREANDSYCFINELEQKGGAYVAQMLGVPAALITSGATGALLLAAAASITGDDMRRVRTLPDTAGMRNEIVVHKDYGDDYNYMYQAMRATGAKLIEVGSRDKLTVDDIKSGLSERTCAIELWLRYRDQPRIEAVYPIAESLGVPIIVDAAGQTPPRSTFTEPIKEGASYVALSGGKGLYGPQGAGLLLGRSLDLIEAARINASPNSAIGRAMKVGRETICAMIVSLEAFLERDEGEDIREYKRRSDHIVNALADIRGIKPRTEMADPTSRPVVPRVYIELDPAFPLTARDVYHQMLDGDPAIVIGSDLHTPDPRTIRVDVLLLRGDEIDSVVRRLREVLTAGKPT